VDILNQTWSYLYQGVNQANAVIGRAPAVADMDDLTKKTRVAEAKFLRALYYFNIVRLWGSAPMPVEETIGAVVTAPKATETEIYAQIVTDLTDAITDL